MDDDKSTAQDVTTTEVVEDSPVVATEDDATVVQAETEPSETSQDVTEETPSAPEVDDKLRNYAANQGIELDSPGAIKAAQLAMKNQADKTREYQKKSELEKATVAVSDEDATATAAATGQDPELLKRVQRVEVRENVRDFWNTPLNASGDMPDRNLEKAMVEQVEQKPYLAGDLKALYATALFESGGVAAVKSQAAKDTLSKLAHTQQAATPKGNASQRGAPAKKEFKDLSIKEMEAQLGTVRR